MVVKILVSEPLAVEFDRPPFQRTIVRPIKYISRCTGNVLVTMSSVFHLFRGVTVPHKSDQTGGDRDVRIFLPWSTIGAIPCLTAKGTLGKVHMRTDEATTSVRAAVIQLRFESRQKRHTRANGIKFWERCLAGKRVG
jgi:hypothetical protein